MSQTRRAFVAGAAAFSFAAGRAPAFAQQKLTPIRIVVTPVTNYTGLLVGRDNGWFEEQGLNVSWSPVAQTAIAVEVTQADIACSAPGGNASNLCWVLAALCQERIAAEVGVVRST